MVGEAFGAFARECDFRTPDNTVIICIFFCYAGDIGQLAWNDYLVIEQCGMPTPMVFD